ncbi:hypothetical protein C9J01_21645 [Photobacterium rosenbergii]|uniref:DUF819 domain-containing protein n=1 Tax=Photobacterium rosenbergii TaxID=294936 RepID=A0A2T3N809_9GAMM|nr:DUF819 family protein [Photobacterium rosenbergii]PSW09231.1 hypothetical protein C9J01_21645 [Photobacterium rosenbergii]
MITEGFDFIAVMFGLCGLLVWLEQRYPSQLFKWFPSIVLVMFGSMALYTFGMWEMTPEVKTARATVRDNAIPAMLFLMSLSFNLSVIRKLGARLIILFLASTASIMAGFIVVHSLMGGFLSDETPLTFGVMSAGWTGGTQNFVAVKEALSVTDSAMAYTLLMGALCYTVWLIMIVALKPMKERFNGVLKANDNGLDEILSKLGSLEKKEKPDLQAILLMLGVALVISSISRHLGQAIASMGLLNPMIWAIIISSLLGILAAPTALGKMAGANEVSGVMLYVVVALIGAEVNLSAIGQAPMYIMSGFMILAVHGVLMLIIGRMMKMNLHLIGLASIANIGSAPSAAVVAAAYDKNLVPVAVIMALIGSMIGSFVGLTVSEVIVLMS